MESDDRFKHLVSDPRFKVVRKKQRKVKIDERFQSMFTDEKFTLDYKQDKRGRGQKKTSKDDLKKYYSLDGDSEDEKEKVKRSKNIAKKGEAVPDLNGDNSDQNGENDQEDDVNDNDKVEDGQNEENEVDNETDIEDEEVEEHSIKSGTEESELSSSSDEAESDDDELEADNLEQIRYDWQPLDHDAELATEITRRLAIQNLDWNSIDIRDIYVLINSIRPPLNVKLYISEFGKERLAKEEIDGPLELADMPQLDEDEEDFKRIEDQMRYIQNRSSKTSQKYEPNDYEDADEIVGSKSEEIRERLRRYQLNQMKYYYAIAEFDSPESAQTVYKELDGIEYEGSSLELDLRYVPDNVEFEPADIKAECDKVPDLATYKAPQFINTALQQTTVKFTWDETDSKRQKKLRKAFTKEELEKDDLEAYLASETDSDADECDAKYKELLSELNKEDEAKKKKVDVDVQWGDNSNSDGGKSGDDDDNEDAGLDLLVLDSNERENFKFNPDDERFKAVYESGLYNIDPSHPNFKRTEALDQIAEKKREKRRKVK